MSSKMGLEEKKARILIKLRGYKLLKREANEEKGIISLHVNMVKAKKNALIWCILTPKAVGVAYVNQLRKTMDKEEIEKGVIVTNGRYTQAAKVKAEKGGIELIPKIFPSFDLFKHKLVPKHEILTLEERDKLISEYRIHPYQLPRITSSDPAVIAIGGQPGDVVRVIRDSPTAGKYVAYRYVVQS